MCIYSFLVRDFFFFIHLRTLSVQRQTGKGREKDREMIQGQRKDFFFFFAAHLPPVLVGVVSDLNSVTRPEEKEKTK